jgi:acetamidase/formamidase
MNLIHPAVSPLGRRLGWAVALLAPALASFGFEVQADYHVPLTPENVAIGYYPAGKAPVAKVPSGAIVTIDGGGGTGWRSSTPAPAGGGQRPATEASIADADAWLKKNGIPITVETSPALAETMRVLKETPRAPGIPSGHLLVGPIFVEGAEPGDTLEVRILHVIPRIPYGMTSGAPGRGGLADVVPRPFAKVIHLDLERNAAIFDHNVEIPLGPFMGVMATCPPESEGPYPKSSPPGAFGGNLDCKELVAGSTLYLPVFRSGALFYTGDSHAAQGDGEVTITAVETANTCTLQFIVHKGKKLAAPRAETPMHYLAFGLDPDLGKAMHRAILETIDFLKEKQGYDFFDAYALASIGVDFRVTQVVDGTLGIHSMIPKKLFINDSNGYWYRPN